MNRIYKKPKKPFYATSLARALRKKSTLVEELLWQELRNRKLKGLKFRRQKPIGRYIADFYCAEKSLCVELDGSSHKENERYDGLRDRLFEGIKLKVLRISNERIVSNIEEVLLEIADAAECCEPIPFSHNWEKGQG